jgi:hypothetical protein
LGIIKRQAELGCVSTNHPVLKIPLLVEARCSTKDERRILLKRFLFATSAEDNFEQKEESKTYQSHK